MPKTFGATGCFASEGFGRFLDRWSKSRLVLKYYLQGAALGYNVTNDIALTRKIMSDRMNDGFLFVAVYSLIFVFQLE